jgi:hypothetical protein
MIDVPDGSRIDVDEVDGLMEGVSVLAGEPRMRHVHARDGAADAVLETWRRRLGDGFWVAAREEAIDGGWFGPVPAGHRDRIGEIVVICRDRTVVLASGWEPPGVSGLIAFHGSATAAEMTVPLLVVPPG